MRTAHIPWLALPCICVGLPDKASLLFMLHFSKPHF